MHFSMMGTFLSARQRLDPLPVDIAGSGPSLGGGRRVSAGATVLVLLLSVCTGAGQKPDLTGVRIVTHPVAGHISMLEATGDVAGNIAVSVGPDGVLIVDDQWAELTDAISDALRALDRGPLRFIINTHHHDDHSDGNADLGQSGALIIAHEKARERLLAKDSAHWPVITFDSSLSVYFNGEEVRALSVPGGHTDNDIVVFFTESNVVHMGDLFNSGPSSFPIADLDSGGNAVKILRNIELLLPQIPEDARVIPRSRASLGQAGAVPPP